MPTKRYTPASHSFFDDLAALLGALCTYMYAIDFIAYNKVPSVISDPAFPMEVGSITLAKVYTLRPHQILRTAAADTVPSMIELEEGNAGLAPATLTLRSTSHKRIASQIIEGGFLRYYENKRHAVVTRYGSDTTSWPVVWNFARIVRNAFGHGGRINFTNASAASVSWNGLTHSYSDNGRVVLFNDLAICDIIFLMEEMDSVI